MTPFFIVTAVKTSNLTMRRMFENNALRGTSEPNVDANQDNSLVLCISKHGAPSNVKSNSSLVCAAMFSFHCDIPVTAVG
jgi:hypothetical protein